MRCRFYGKKDGKNPSKSDTVFVERKTHHESWVNMKSVKERFDVKSKHVRPYVDGNFDIPSFFEAQVKSGALDEVRSGALGGGYCAFAVNIGRGWLLCLCCEHR